MEGANKNSSVHLLSRLKCNKSNKLILPLCMQHLKEVINTLKRTLIPIDIIRLFRWKSLEVFFPERKQLHEFLRSKYACSDVGISATQTVYEKCHRVAFLSATSSEWWCRDISKLMAI